jgi:hypothetical protein
LNSLAALRQEGTLLAYIVDLFIFHVPTWSSRKEKQRMTHSLRPHHTSLLVAHFLCNASVNSTFFYPLFSLLRLPFSSHSFLLQAIKQSKANNRKCNYFYLELGEKNEIKVEHHEERRTQAFLKNLVWPFHGPTARLIIFLHERRMGRFKSGVNNDNLPCLLILAPFQQRRHLH